MDNLSVIGILPTTIDTPSNRDAMPKGNFDEWTNPNDIAKKLKLDDAKDLNSYESLKAAMEKNYPPKLVQSILDNFSESGIVKDIGVPDDLKTETLADKNYNRVVALSKRLSV